MDGTEKKLVALARGGDMQLRSAAILVLGELGCDDPAAVAAVDEALRSGNAVLQEFGFAYADKLRADALLPALVPFLAAPESPARDRAARLLAEAGASGVAAASAELPRLDRRRRGPVAAWLAQQQGRRSREALLRLLASDEAEAQREAAHALVAASTSADDDWRAAVAARLVAPLERASRDDGRDEATTLALLDLAATLGRSDLRKVLLELARATAGRLRAAAVRALAAALHQAKPAAAELRFLLGLLEEEDEWVVRAAADLLAAQPLPGEHLALLTRLASGRSAAARRFALAKMAELDSSAVVKTLLAHLDDVDHVGRSAAQAALKQVDGAHGLLVKQLLACDDERRAWVLADVLAARNEPWTRGEATALVARLEESVDRDDRLWSALLHAVRAAGLEERAAAALVERGVALFKKRNYSGAVRRLALRLDLPGADDETRFQLALARLAATARPAGLARRRDEALEALAALERGTFPIVERLRKARVLGPDELFYVAFNLAEQPATRPAAGELLRHVVKLSPRSKVGKAARNKLALVERAGQAAGAGS